MDNITSLFPHMIALAAALIGIAYLLARRKKSEVKSRAKDYDVLIWRYDPPIRKQAAFLPGEKLHG